jgi:phosphoribosylamine---glycine ligase
VLGLNTWNMTMRILVIGSGGREHTIAWKLRQSPHVSDLHCAPGNAGIAQIARCTSVDVNDPSSIADLAVYVGADLTFVGPEAPLVAGVADEFARRNLRLVGPTAAAARLEGSKIFTKQFMGRHRVPTARFTACDSPSQAQAAVERDYKFPVVVKADGLAAGKGVRIAFNRVEFDEAITSMMVDRVFGKAGSRTLLEEHLTGREASLMVFTDGRDFRTLVPAQDYKRVNDNDQGPNTGGMGSFSTPGLIDQETLAQIEREIIAPTLEGMAAEGNPFRGILYAGLMLTDQGPRVIEFNVRLGDPETQVVLTRLSSDLVEILQAVVDGTIGSSTLAWSQCSTVCIVAASGGYPGEFSRGKPISGLEDANSVRDVVVFHAGTSADNQGRFLTAGGRVLGVTARAESLSGARARAYEAIRKISFEGLHYRTDIGEGRS